MLKICEMVQIEEEYPKQLIFIIRHTKLTANETGI